MIRSILDTDLYKFTTSYAYFKLYPEAIGTFTFNDRAKTEFDEDFLDDLKAELKALNRLFSWTRVVYFAIFVRFEDISRLPAVARDDREGALEMTEWTVILSEVEGTVKYKPT